MNVLSYTDLLWDESSTSPKCMLGKIVLLSVVDVDIAYDEIGVGVLMLYAICGRRVDLPTFDDVGGRSRSRTACHAVSRRETAVARNEYGRMRLIGRCGPKELNRPSEQ